MTADYKNCDIFSLFSERKTLLIINVQKFFYDEVVWNDTRLYKSNTSITDKGTLLNNNVGKEIGQRHA